MKKAKILNLSLILTSFLGYLEWGGNNTSFLIESEIEVITKSFSNISAIIHPFILLPLIGQIMLLFTLFQSNPSKKLTYAGIICLSVLLVFMSVIGVFSLNYKIFLSTIPFLVTAFLIIKQYRK